MARHPCAISQPLAKTTVGDCILREGRMRDATTIQAWSTISLSELQLIASASTRLVDEDGTCFVGLGPDGSRIGVMIVEVPYLEFVYFIGIARMSAVAVGLVIALVDHYFASEPEPLLEAGQGLLPTSRGVLDRFGFEDRPLDRPTWALRREALLRTTARPHLRLVK